MWPCVFFYILGAAVAFNLAPDAAQVFQDPFREKESYFGYTVALQSSPFRLLVGSPRSSSQISSHRLLTRPGTVFLCPITGGRLSNCQEMTLEQAGETQREDLKYWDRKIDAWIGGSLDVSRSTQNLVTCGFRWSNQIHADYYLMNGVCYTLNDTSRPSVEAQKLIPLLDSNKQRFENSYNYAYGQAGFSAHFTPASELLLGAPGLAHWNGGLVKYGSDYGSTFPTPPIISDPFYVKSMPPYPYGYFGYSVTSGKFRTDEIIYCSSAPRAESYFGAVLLFRLQPTTRNLLDVVVQLNGTQMGEYFGASLCSVDVDGDGLDDLLVGAPLNSPEQIADSGKVYVYLNQRLWDGKMPLELTGSTKSGARFGTAISSVGDLDLDGYQDVAIGAPYEENGKSTGAVYIYRGGLQGLSAVPSQVIVASAVASNLRGFGISISRGIDLDYNSYPDIAVGAHESGHVAIIKSQPVVRLLPRLIRSIHQVTFNTTDFILNACFSYQGKFVPPPLDINVVISVDKVHRRAMFGLNGQTISFPTRLLKTSETCLPHSVSLLPSSQWSASATYASIPIQLTASLVPKPFCATCPVLDIASNASIVTKLPVSALCGKEDCVPVWKVSARFINVSTPFVQESAEAVLLRIQVWNEGDNAHLQKLNISLQSNVSLRTLPSACSRGEVPSQWTCLPGSRIDSGDKLWVDLNLAISSNFDKSQLEVNVSAHAFDSDIVERTRAVLPVVRISRMEIVGRATPNLIVLPADNKGRQQLLVTHSYQAYCSGFTPIHQVAINIQMPYRVRLPGVWLPLVSFSIEGGGSNCTIVNDEEVKAPSESVGGLEVKMAVVRCLSGPLYPRSEGLSIAIAMNVSLSTMAVFLSSSNHISLNTSAVGSAVGEPGVLARRTVTTVFAGPVPEKSDPFLWLYIALAVIAALVLLLCIAFLLSKIGFFKRFRQPEQTEDEAALKGELIDEN